MSIIYFIISFIWYLYSLCSTINAQNNTSNPWADPVWLSVEDDLIFYTRGVTDITEEELLENMDSVITITERVDPQNKSKVVLTYKIWGLTAAHRYAEADSILNTIDDHYLDFYSPCNTAVLRLKVNAQQKMSEGDTLQSKEYVTQILTLLDGYLQNNREEIEKGLNSPDPIYFRNESGYVTWTVIQYYCYYSVVYGKAAADKQLEIFLKSHPHLDEGFVEHIKGAVDSFDLLGPSPR